MNIFSRKTLATRISFSISVWIFGFIRNKRVIRSKCWRINHFSRSPVSFTSLWCKYFFNTSFLTTWNRYQGQIPYSPKSSSTGFALISCWASSYIFIIGYATCNFVRVIIWHRGSSNLSYLILAKVYQNKKND